MEMGVGTDNRDGDGDGDVPMTAAYLNGVVIYTILKENYSRAAAIRAPNTKSRGIDSFLCIHVMIDKVQENLHMALRLLQCSSIRLTIPIAFSITNTISITITTTIVSPSNIPCP